jgi:hypothetical protein
MRSAGNFHPEWGYLAPAPSFLRTARVALVATAIGATAGAVVVVSLVVHPGANDENSSIAAHALVTAAPLVTTPAVSTPPAGHTPAAPNTLAQAPTRQPQAPAVHTAAQPQAPAGKSEPDNFASASKSDPVATPTIAASTNATALADTPPADVAPGSASPDSIMAPEVSPTKRSEFRRHRLTSAEAARREQAEATAKKRWHDNRGLDPLFRLFSFRGSSSYDN